MSNSEFLASLNNLLGKDPHESSTDLTRLSEEFQPSPESVELLANACRESEWRIPLQKAGFLVKCLEEVTLDILSKNEPLSYQILRYVCNSAADTDENREIILPSMEVLIAATRQQGLVLAGLSAVLNLCRDFQKGQSKAVELSFLDDLESLIRTGSRQEIHISLDIFGLLLPTWQKAGKKVPSSLVNRAIMEMARAPGIVSSQDDFLTCIDFLIPVLQDEEVLKILAEKENQSLALDLIVMVKYRLYGRLRAQKEKETKASGKPTEESEDDEDDDAEELSALSKALNSVMLISCSIVSLWTLDFKNLSDDEEFRDLVRWLSTEWRKSYAKHPLENHSCTESLAAALMLGNLVQSDEAAEAIAQHENVLTSAIDIINDADGQEIKDAAAGLLSNLAVAKQNKTLMREQGVFEAVDILISKDLKTDAALVLDGVKLLRRMIRDSSDNVKFFLIDSEHETEKNTYGRFVSLLLRISVGSSSIAESQTGPKIETELALFIVDLLRTVSAKTDSEVIAATESLLNIPIISSLLVSLTNHPDLATKSKAILGLALLTRYPSAAQVFWKHVLTDEKKSPISHFLLDPESKFDENEENAFAKEDKQNLGMMIGYLIKADIPEMSQDDQSKLEKKMAGLASE